MSSDGPGPGDAAMSLGGEPLKEAKSGLCLGRGELEGPTSGPRGDVGRQLSELGRPGEWSASVLQAGAGTSFIQQSQTYDHSLGRAEVLLRGCEVKNHCSPAG